MHLTDGSKGWGRSLLSWTIASGSCALPSSMEGDSQGQRWSTSFFRGASQLPTFIVSW